MSKTRQRPRPQATLAPLDGHVWVRTSPVTFLHDHTWAPRRHRWHLLAFAAKGHLEVVTGQTRHLVPSDRAVWVPAGTVHAEVLRAPVTVRSLYLSPKAGSPLVGVRTIAVTPLLRELIQHISRLGALDRRDPVQRRLIAVLVDLLAQAREVSLTLAAPLDPRARAFAELIAQRLDDPAPLATLARRAGASVRTLERCFLAETGLRVGEWRRRLRLFHALRLLERGERVTSVALEVGYSSTSAFCHAFSAQFGHSPRRGRR